MTDRIAELRAEQKRITYGRATALEGLTDALDALDEALDIATEALARGDMLEMTLEETNEIAACKLEEADDAAYATGQSLLRFGKIIADQAGKIDNLEATLDKAMTLVQHTGMCYGLRNFERECDCGAYQLRVDYEKRRNPIRTVHA